MSQDESTAGSGGNQRAEGETGEPRTIGVGAEELALWRQSNDELTKAANSLADRLDVVASRQEIDAAMEQRMALVEREAAEALEVNVATSRASRSRAWGIIIVALLFSVLISMQLRDVAAYQCYPQLSSGREANTTVCDAVFPFSPHDFGASETLGTARIIGGVAYVVVALGIAGLAVRYRRKFAAEGTGSDRLLRRSREREAEATQLKQTADQARRLDEQRRAQRRRRKGDPPPEE